MIRHTCIFVILLSIILSCKNRTLIPQEKWHVFHPFHNIEFTDLTSLGFERALGVDMPMYILVKEDLVSRLTYDFEKSSLISKSWLVLKEFTSEEQLTAFFYKHQSYILSETSWDDILLGKAFFVESKKYGTFYKCNYEKGRLLIYLPLIDNTYLN